MHLGGVKAGFNIFIDGAYIERPFFSRRKMKTIDLAKKGNDYCRGCTMIGMCIIKAMEREYTCPCLVCPVLVMCKVACDPFTAQREFANRIHIGFE